METLSGINPAAFGLSPVAGLADAAETSLMSGHLSPSRPGGFASLLGRAAGPDADEKRAREAAEEFVATALVKPVLARMRESNQAAPPFAPGPYEKQFGPLVDAEIAKRMVRAGGFDVVDAVARNLLKASQRHAAAPIDVRG